MRDKFVVLASSTSVPLSSLGVKKSMDGKLKERLKAALLGMKETSEGKKVLETLGAERLIETKDSEYEPLLDMLNTLGIKPEDIAPSAIGIPQRLGHSKTGTGR